MQIHDKKGHDMAKGRDKGGKEVKKPKQVKAV